MGRILVVDDEEAVRTAVRRRLERDGHQITLAASAEEAAKKIREEEFFDVIVTDMSIDGPTSGLDVLKAAFQKDLFAEVIVMTAYGNISNAVESMRSGAFDYVEKNNPNLDAYEYIALKVERALERRLRDLRTVELWERTANARTSAH